MRKTYYVVQRSSDSKFWDGVGWVDDIESAALFSRSGAAIEIMEEHLRKDGKGFWVQRVAFTVDLSTTIEQTVEGR